MRTWLLLLVGWLGVSEGTAQRCGWLDFYHVVGISFVEAGSGKPMKRVKASLRDTRNRTVIHGEVEEQHKHFPVLDGLYCAFVPSGHVVAHPMAPPRYWVVVEDGGDELFFPLQSEGALPACGSRLNHKSYPSWDDPASPLQERPGGYRPLRIEVPPRKDRAARAELGWDEAVTRVNLRWDEARVDAGNPPTTPQVTESEPPGECLAWGRRGGAVQSSEPSVPVWMAGAGQVAWVDTLWIRNRCNRPVSYRLESFGAGLVANRGQAAPGLGMIPADTTWMWTLDSQWEVAPGSLERLDWVLRWLPTSGRGSVWDTTLVALVLGEGWQRGEDVWWGPEPRDRPGWRPAVVRAPAGAVQWGMVRSSDRVQEGRWQELRPGEWEANSHVFSKEVNVVAGSLGPDAVLEVAEGPGWVRPWATRMPWGWVFYAGPACRAIRVRDGIREVVEPWSYDRAGEVGTVTVHPAGPGDVVVRISEIRYVLRPVGNRYRVRWDGVAAAEHGLTWEDMPGWMERFGGGLDYVVGADGMWEVDWTKWPREVQQQWRLRWLGVPGVQGLDRVLQMDGGDYVWTGTLSVQFRAGEEAAGRRSVEQLGFGCLPGDNALQCLTYRRGGCDVEEWGYIERLGGLPGIERVSMDWLYLGERNE